MSDSLEQYKYAGRKRFNIAKFDTADKGEFSDRQEAVDEFVSNLKKINKLQQALYAERKEGVIFVFQAMDAAGKDGVIRTVFSTLSPHGVKEYCFKVPSAEELSHDFLWRFWSAMPPKGHISIFNRSYYEDVLVGKVHELWKGRIFPDRIMQKDIIKERYGMIKGFEQFMYNSGTRIVKIFLNVSKDEQARRFISRIDTDSKNWKISSGDLKERGYWDAYMDAFEKMINTTSTEICPWYVVPADHKWYARLLVSRIVLQTLEEIDPQWPTITEDELGKIQEFRQSLVDSLPNQTYEPNTESLQEFAKTAAIAADMWFDDETTKIKDKKERIRTNGMNAIRALHAEGRKLSSPTEVIAAVVSAMQEDTTNEEE